MAEELPNYSIRPMQREEIPAVLQLWRETGLSEGTYSLDTWFDHDPEGFYVAVTDDGIVLGACAGILQNESLAFVGLYVVKSIYRRRGIGRKIWNAVMERIGDRNVGVNPVPEQLENYRDRSGFPVQTSWCSVVSIAQEVDVSNLSSDNPDVNIQLVTTAEEDIMESIAQYDADVCGFSRGNLVPLLCAQEESITMVATGASSNEVCGYGNVRKNIKGGATIGPLYADSLEIAESLMYELITNFTVPENKTVMMMCIDCNHSAMEMAEKLGFQNEEIIARLYRSEEIPVKYDKVFSQQNLNFSIF